MSALTYKHGSMQLAGLLFMPYMIIDGVQLLTKMKVILLGSIHHLVSHLSMTSDLLKVPSKYVG